MTEKVRSRILIQSADRPEIEYKVACDVIESIFLNSTVSMTLQATLNSISGRSADCIGVRLWTFLRHSLNLSPMAFSIKIGRVPYPVS